MQKSTRHSKITGDFAEALVLYWLSKDGYECARIDHTGIDLIASKGGKRIGISVKCRSRFDGTERVSINLPTDGFEKARQACIAFGCTPYYAMVIDGGKVVRCFLLSLDSLEGYITGKVGNPTRYWQMTDSFVGRYRTDRAIRWFEMSWHESSDQESGSSV
jgi:hypothetical protein